MPAEEDSIISLPLPAYIKTHVCSCVLESPVGLQNYLQSDFCAISIFRDAGYGMMIDVK